MVFVGGGLASCGLVPLRRHRQSDRCDGWGDPDLGPPPQHHPRAVLDVDHRLDAGEPELLERAGADMIRFYRQLLLDSQAP